ncbi:MAG: histidine phosphatase family protein [Myxococcales bacterium]|nr:histidine phosphatase family protein [Myxococcales bacterium]
MRLYVMRHGPAEDRSESGLDEDRALTSAGRDRVRAVAKALVEAEEEPLAIVTSPLIRTVQSAEIVAVITRLDTRQGTLLASRELTPGSSALPLVHRLAETGGRRVMVVGHEPDLSALVANLLGAPFTRAFDKAMVVGIHLADDGQARLRFVLDPKGPRLEVAHVP